MQRRREREGAAKPSRSTAATKLFVLDTNVLMHDPTSLFRFEEHDVYLPMVTLEELDDNKKGMSEVSRNARQASRFLDEIVSHGEGDIENGYSLKGKSNGEALGCLFLQTHSVNVEIPDSVASQKADNVILGVAAHLKQKYPKRDVVLVSKDINMRIKAHAIGHPRRGLLQRQGARGHRPPLHRRHGAARRTSGTSTARTWRAGRSTAAPCTASRARWCPRCW